MKHRKLKQTGMAAALAAAAIIFSAPSYAQFFNRLYVRPDTASAIWVRGQGAQAGGTAPVVIASRISNQPQARWYANWSTGEGINEIRNLVANDVRAAFAVEAIPQLVPYMIPARDCQSASSGGAGTIAEYERWISEFAAGLSDGFASYSGPFQPQVIILLEPDALALQEGDPDCKGEAKTDTPVMFPGGVAARDAALANAVRKLTGAGCINGASTCAPDASKVKVFLDAAHSGWYGGRETTMAQRLRDGGIADAAGFFTNVSNYRSIADEEAYGAKIITQLVGAGLTGKMQIIDTSRNGVAVSTDLSAKGWPSWCDNETARLGEVPALRGALAGLSANHVYARLWVKLPGEVDGCYDAIPGDQSRRGVPLPGNPQRVEAGTFDVDRACKLINGEVRGAAPIGACGAINTIAAPAAPTGLRFTSFRYGGQFGLGGGLGKPYVQLEWTPSTGACFYQIQRGINGGGLTAGGGTFDSFIAGSNGVGPNTVWLDTKIPDNATRLQYRVRARACDASNYTSSSVVTIIP
jgi:hypothetical protein